MRVVQKSLGVVVRCRACDTRLSPDTAAPDTTYAFDNALWIGFHGGYGMFVDNLEVKLPINTEDRWLRKPDGEYETVTDEFGGLHPVDNPDWKPEFREERVLDGHPDYEVVLCHDCAHALCEAVPWINKLIEPLRSHSHREEYMAAHPDHQGWDCSR